MHRKSVNHLLRFNQSNKVLMFESSFYFYYFVVFRNITRSRILKVHTLKSKIHYNLMNDFSVPQSAVDDCFFDSSNKSFNDNTHNIIYANLRRIL